MWWNINWAPLKLNAYDELVGSLTLEYYQILRFAAEMKAKLHEKRIWVEQGPWNPYPHNYVDKKILQRFNDKPSQSHSSPFRTPSNEASRQILQRVGAPSNAHPFTSIAQRGN